jgi:electron transport complex protein RnfD
MYGVALALAPATVYGFYLFGWPALNLFLVTISACLAGEALALWLAGKPVRRFTLDGSALLTGWLLAMSLPPWAPWWIGVIGGLFAILVGKHVFGGIGQNVFNPAMLARVMLLVSFPIEMTLWINPTPWFSDATPGFVEGLAITFAGLSDWDSISSASILGHVRTELGQAHTLSQALADNYQPLSAALGHTSGSLGETSAVLLLLGGIGLLWRRVIRWHIPVAMLGAVTILATGFHLLDPQRYADPLFHLLSGSLILGAFFIATDLVTSPATPRGQLLFGAGCGTLAYIIRTWGGYPEGVAFAVVLMNAVTPVIDHYLRPRIYGRTRGGKPLGSQRAKQSKGERSA